MKYISQSLIISLTSKLFAIFSVLVILSCATTGLFLGSSNPSTIKTSATVETFNPQVICKGSAIYGVPTSDTSGIVSLTTPINTELSITKTSLSIISPNPDYIEYLCPQNLSSNGDLYINGSIYNDNNPNFYNNFNSSFSKSYADYMNLFTENSLKFNPKPNFVGVVCYDFYLQVRDSTIVYNPIKYTNNRTIQIQVGGSTDTCPPAFTGNFVNIDVTKNVTSHYPDERFAVIEGTCKIGGTVSMYVTSGTDNTLYQTIPEFMCINGRIYYQINTRITFGPYCAYASILGINGQTSTNQSCGEIKDGPYLSVLEPPITNNPRPIIEGTCLLYPPNFGIRVTTLDNTDLLGGIIYQPCDPVTKRYSFTPTINIPLVDYCIEIVSEEAPVSNLFFNLFDDIKASAASIETVTNSPGQDQRKCITAAPVSNPTIGGGIITTSPKIKAEQITQLTTQNELKSIQKIKLGAITDPYICGKDIRGKVDGLDDLLGVDVKLYAKLSDGSFSKDERYNYKPAVDNYGQYSISLDYNNETVFQKGEYKVEYQAKFKDSETAPQAYEANLTNKCSDNQVKSDSENKIIMIRTGGAEAGNYSKEIFVIGLMLILLNAWNLFRIAVKNLD